MSLIQISNLTFGYEGSYDTVFENVSLQLDTNWKLGLIGRNGRGKTTLFKLLLGEYAHQGTISTPCPFDYFPFPVEDAAQTGLAVLQEHCPLAEHWQMVRELSLLEVDEQVLYRPFSTLSNGERSKVKLAGLFLRENHCLLIDEPTNHLDVHGRQVVARYLRGKGGFLLISHDRALLDGCVDHILSINKADLQVQRGNFSTWLADKERQDRFELEEKEKLQRHVKQLSAAARRTAGWADEVEGSKYGEKNSGLRPDRGYIGHKSAKMMKRAKTLQHRRQKAVEEAESLLQNVERKESLKLAQLPYHAQRLVWAEDLAISYGDHPVFQGVSFAVERGERIAVTGKNGAGKSSLLKLICGEAVPYTGTLRRGSQLSVSYVSQDTDHLNGSLVDYARGCGIDQTLFQTILRKLDFSRIQFEKDIKDFSAGQKKKVLLAACLCQCTHLMVWDEPLNFIDVISRMQLEELLLEAKPTIIFVEHDRAFCQKIATRELVLGE